MKTTLNQIRKHEPCTDGWQKLLTHLGKTKADDEPLSIVAIIDSNGLQDALWCLRAVEGRDKEICMFAVCCARQVQHLLKDQRSLDALDVAERYADGEATEEELTAARDAAEAAAEAAAWAATSAASAAKAAAWAAAWAAAGGYAAKAASRASAGVAARAASWASAGVAAWYAAEAASDARVACYASEDAEDAGYEMRAKQEAELRRICGEGE